MRSQAAMSSFPMPTARRQAVPSRPRRRARVEGREGRLDGVPDAMTQVELTPLSRFPLVALDDIRLDGHRARDDALHGAEIGREEPFLASPSIKSK